MNKRHYILLTLLILATAILSPSIFALKKIEVKKPDMEEIKRRITDSNDKYYYPKLRKLYERNDTIMTPEEYRYYYLGYIFQEDFNPYRVSEYSSITDSLSFLPKHTKQDCDTIIKYAELSLDDNPFDLKQMSFLIYALKEKRKDMRAKIWQYRLENILGAIKSTGTGEDIDNAWYVNSPAHEYALINAMNFTATGYKEAAPGIDYISIERTESKTGRRKDKTPEGFFFNVRNLQEEYDRKFSDQFINEDESTPVGTKEEVESEVIEIENEKEEAEENIGSEEQNNESNASLLE